MMEILLSDLKNGDEGKIKKLNGGLEFQNKLSSMGIIVGKKIKKNNIPAIQRTCCYKSQQHRSQHRQGDGK